jgi:hypothetical protein
MELEALAKPDHPPMEPINWLDPAIHSKHLQPRGVPVLGNYPGAKGPDEVSRCNNLRMQGGNARYVQSHF